MKAVTIYLELKLKKQFVKLPSEIMQYACCLKSQSFQFRDGDIQISRMETSAMKVELT